MKASHSSLKAQSSLKAKSRKHSTCLSLMVFIVITGLSLTTPVQKRAFAEPKVMAAEKTADKSAIQPATDLEKRLNALQTLYIPIHWSDTQTGLAIGGHDPLTYFTNGTINQGDDRFQYLWHGVAWQFTTKGNLLAFKRTPSVYAPRYAGYDPYAISKGILSEGSPAIWVVSSGKLYLFFNQVNRHLWQENKQKLSAKIEQNWSDLATDLPRYKVF